MPPESRFGATLAPGPRRGATAETTRPVRQARREPVRLRPLIQVPDTPRWWMSAASVLGTGSLVAVTGIWVRNGGAAELLTDQRLVSLGQLTGLYSAVLMLLQLFMIARIPFLERAFGLNELIPIHKTAGIAAFAMLIAHVALIAVGYAGNNVLAGITGFYALISTTGTLPMATVATVLVVLVTLSSLPPFREKLSYERWHLIHLYGYLGAGLAVPHEITLGGNITETPNVKLLWLAIWIACGICVLIWRVAVPIWRTYRHGFVVTKVTEEGPGVYSVDVGARDVDQMPVRAGQYFNVRFLNGPGWMRAHPYSLSAGPKRNGLRFTIKELGDDSSLVKKIRRGTRVMLEGPYGKLTTEVRTRRRLVFMASGIGITPLRALAEDLEYAPGEAVMLYRASSADDLVLRAEMESLARQRGIELVYLVGKRLRGRDSWLPAAVRGRGDAEVLKQLVPDIDRRDVYICGAGGWTDSAVEACMDAGVPADQVHAEKFGW